MGKMRKNCLGRGISSTFERFRPSDVPTCFLGYPISFQTLAHFSTLLHKRKKPPSWQRVRNCLEGGTPNLQLANLSPPVPLQSKHFGATIRKGARFLDVPGKQLRSTRCLRILSGHRELFDAVPGYTPARSGSQVVPGSIVQTMDRSRVA